MDFDVDLYKVKFQSCKSDKRRYSEDSESSSAESIERLRKLFEGCDRDNDGFIDSSDLYVMCQTLSMEDSAKELQLQMGLLSSSSQLNFEQFLRMREHFLCAPEVEETAEQNGELVQCSGIECSLDDANRPIPTLHQLLQHANSKLYAQLQDACALLIKENGVDVLDLANTLHLAALTSLKGEIIELNTRLQQVNAEKDYLQQQLNQSQLDRVRYQREADAKLHSVTSQYEGRITELHGVIAELNKKLERLDFSVIREEDEYLEKESVVSNDDRLLQHQPIENNGCPDFYPELQDELSHVICELDSALGESRLTAGLVPDGEGQTAKATLPVSDPNNDSGTDQVPPDSDSIEEKALQEADSMNSDLLSRLAQENEVKQLRTECNALRGQVARQEIELNKLKAQLGGVREERDRLRRRVREQQAQVDCSRTSTPTKADYCSSESSGPRMAELKKLRTNSADRRVTGAELSCIGASHGKLAEHLVKEINEEAHKQELINQAINEDNSTVPDNRLKEFQLELCRLNSRIDNLRAQNELLNITLAESKAHNHRLTVLLGKYESNHTAQQLAIAASDRALEAYDVVTSLVDSEQGVLLANCRAAGIGNTGEASNETEVSKVLSRAQHARRSAETCARALLSRTLRGGGAFDSSSWDESSSNSHTTVSTSSSMTSGIGAEEWTKSDEQKLRAYLEQLRQERHQLLLTVMDLESVHLDSVEPEVTSPAENSKVDLENAVLLQELMAMKEERAELKAQNYLLERERGSLELQISGKESQEQAYKVQIEHLKSEVDEREVRLKNDSSDNEAPVKGGLSLETLADHDARTMGDDLGSALKREKVLKDRVQELVISLEKLSTISETKRKQSAEFVNDLKRANSALVSAFEKSKKKYQSRVKKLEGQLQVSTERYEAQLRMHRQRVSQIDETGSRVSNETSL